MLGPVCSCGHVLYDHDENAEFCEVEGCGCIEFDHDLDQTLDQL
jgi:hypothetical protein